MHQRKRWRTRISITMFSLIMAVTMLLPTGMQMTYADEAAGDAPVYYDGTYEGTGKGYGGNVTVSVTIRDGKIAGIEEVSQNETASYWNEAKVLFETIQKEQTTEVDSISGATKSSNGIKAAVNDALAKAMVDPNGWYASGDGSAKKPYLIRTAEQLVKFAAAVDEGEDFAGRYIALDEDIELSGIENWNPIGTEGATASAKKFAGSFDGRGHKVKGMKISGEFTTETNVGLFAAVDKTAVIRDVHMTDVNIAVTGSGVLRAGGIVGDTVNGTADAGTLVDRCSVSGSVSADSSGAALVFAAGIIGRGMTWVKVSNSWANAEVSAISRGGNNSGYAGGVIGMSGNNSLIVNCASFGTIYGSSPKSTNFGGMAGGLGGMLSCKAYNAYATGNVTVGNGGSSHKWIGALAGEFPTGGMVKQGDGSYLYPETGAFRKYAYYADGITLKIETWQGDEAKAAETELKAVGTSQTTAYDKVFETVAQAVPRVDMKAQSFADTLNANLKETRKLLDAYGYMDIVLYHWTATDSGVLPVGEKWVNTEPDASIFEGGTGTAEDPFRIATEAQLRSFAGSLTEGIDYAGYCICVTEDLDISSAEWTPVGGQEFAFNGTFDGGGHSIRGMHAGTEETPYVMGEDNPYMGFFGVLGKNAVVKDLHLTDVSVYATTPKYVYLGGIAGINDADSTTRAGMVIDSCSVTGRMTVIAEESNSFLGGIIASQYRGAVINCMTDLDLRCTVKTGSAIAEVGGLAAMNNRGLIANCYTLGNVYGSASRSGGDEGMASTGNLVGVQAGDLVGCYSKGNNETGEYSVYAGELAGWITGIGKVYSCYYNKEAQMVIDGRKVEPPADFGTKVAPGVNEEGDAYVGGIVDELVGFTASGYKDLAAALNAKFTEYPIDLSVYGFQGAVLRQWKYDEGSQLVTWNENRAETVYKQPQAELVPPDVEEMHDGTFFGRDPEKKVIVKIIVRNHELVGEPAVVSGNASDTEAFEAALSKAKSKALYGDTTGYGAADTKRFGGGNGTKEDPYLISNETQLRAIAEAINEDETFENVWFRQTADIDVSSEEWLPIGFGIMAKVKKTWKTVATYPFLGNYDGDSHLIKGMRIGSEEEPSTDPRVNFTAGLFGFIAGDHNSNEKITGNVRLSRLENIRLRGVNIHVSGEGQNYVGALVGNAQNGFLIDSCSAAGKLSAFSKDSIARGAGIAGNAIRGTILNSWTDVAVTAETDAGNAYAGGLYALDNRATSVNCFSLGSITGNAGANNKVHIGGLSGQAGGVHYNCYTAGDITSLKTTSDAGLAEGRLAGIAADKNVYYCSDAVLTVAGTVRETQAIGVSIPKDPDVQAKTKNEMSNQDFVNLLNANAQSAAEALAALQTVIDAQTDLQHMVQFSGDVNSLAKWILNQRAVLEERNANAGQEQKQDDPGKSEEAKKKAAKVAYRKAFKAAKARKVTGFKVKAQKKRKAKVNWKKTAGASGYEIFRSTKKNGKYKKVATIGKAGTKKFVNKKLKTNVQYFYKMRPYTLVKNVSGKTIKVYGKWTKIKMIRAK